LPAEILWLDVALRASWPLSPSELGAFEIAHRSGLLLRHQAPPASFCSTARLTSTPRESTAPGIPHGSRAVRRAPKSSPRPADASPSSGAGPVRGANASSRSDRPVGPPSRILRHPPCPFGVGLRTTFVRSRPRSPQVCSADCSAASSCRPPEPEGSLGRSRMPSTPAIVRDGFPPRATRSFLPMAPRCFQVLRYDPPRPVQPCDLLLRGDLPEV